MPIQPVKKQITLEKKPEFQLYMEGCAKEEKLQLLVSSNHLPSEEEKENLSAFIDEAIKFFYHGLRDVEKYRTIEKPIMDKVYLSDIASLSDEELAYRERYDALLSLL